MFWRAPAATFARLCDLLVPGGTLATTYQPRHAQARPQDADAMAARVSEWLRAAGFTDVRVERLELRPLPAICVLARRAPVPGAPPTHAP